MVNNYKQDEEKTTFSWKNVGRILPFLKPYKKEFIISILLGIFSSLLLLLQPKIIAYAIDVSFVNKDFREIVFLTLIMLISILISIFLSKIKNNKMFTILDLISNDLKNAIFEKLQYLPHDYFDTRSHGKIYVKATTYPSEVSIIMCNIFVEVLLEMITLIFVLIFMLFINIKLSLITLFLTIILIIIFIIIIPVRRKLQEACNEKNANVNAYLSESIHGIRITQSFNREAKNEQILKQIEKERIHARKRLLFAGNLNWSLTGIFDTISMLCIYYFGLNYFYPTVSLGEIVAIVSYSSWFWDPIDYLMRNYSSLMDASTYLERIFELLDEPYKIENSKNCVFIDIKGDVSLKDVVFRYDENRIILNHFNLDIKAGEKIGIVGETGSGKSTILSLISRFYDVEEGGVFIDHVNIKEIALSSLRGNVSVMLQENFLFARTVYENLVLNKDIEKEQVIDICKMLDVHDIIMNLENGYDTILLNNGSGLSSGEKQLLCMARIMIQNPKILILDEATSNIDVMTEKKIQKALQIITSGRTTIMVAHRISTIKDCDKIVLVKDHKNYEEGTHDMLMKKKGAYYRLYQKQTL